jgi:hypothetical protein
MNKKQKEKLETAKIKARKKAEEAKAKKRPRGEVGEFGFGEKTMNHKFCKSISKSPKTMAQIKKEKWNEKGVTFYECFKKLKEEKVAKLTAEKQMYIVGSKAQKLIKSKKNKK